MRNRTLSFLLIVLVGALMLAACASPAPEAVEPADEPAPAEEAEPADAEAAPAEAEEEEAAPAEEEPAAEEPVEEGEPVTLTFGSWRTDDVAQMERILAAFHEAHPDITVQFAPTDPPEYDAALRTQLETGTGPDVFYLRSTGITFDLYNEGHLVPVDDLEGLANMTPESIETWTADDGQVVGIGYIATSAGVFYNEDIFAELGLEVPGTWEEFLQVSQEIQDAGYEPIANASGDSWTVATLLLQNWIPNIIGGPEGRLEYQTGERCLNDEQMAEAYQRLVDIAPYLPAGQEALSYYDSQQLFLLEESPMWIGGSWDIPYFELEEPEFAWSIFPVPAAEGDPNYMEWELDAGVGINAASEHVEEAKVFLEWLTTEESAQLLASELPGFFPMTTDDITIDNAHAQRFLEMRNEVEGTDIRFYMSEGDPSSVDLMVSDGVAVLAGDMTPQEAADSLYEGVSSWSDVQANCGQ